jgi:uncharacterized protein (DUF697 family)
LRKEIMSENQPNSCLSDETKKQSQGDREINSEPKPTFVTLLANLGKTAINTGKAFASKALNLGGTAAKQSYQWMEQTTEGAGRAVALIDNIPLLKNPFVQKVIGLFKLDWLVGMSAQVDLVKAQEQVKQLQQKHPDESSAKIAHRIMVSKAARASGIGFVSSIVPGAATALLAIDLAATTAMQTEMIYQIAAAYGLDLQDPARKGEVLAIFGLALGGKNAIRAGLGFMRNIPLAGAMIGASTNATMLYSLGYAACRFYEAKSEEDLQEPTTEILEALQQESEEYLDVAVAQQAIVDQILVHAILASYPEKKWEDIVPELKALQVDPASLDVIAANIESPQPLDELLDRLNRDFAIPLLAQCHHIAQSSGDISSQEAKVLEAISQSKALRDR